MKKIIHYAAWALLVLVAALLARQYEVGKEITVFLKMVAQKVVPWVNAAIYS